MNPLEWNAQYETGIPVIDEQHKELFRIANELLSLLVRSAEDDVVAEIQKELNSLEKYTQYHFKTEETLFEKYAYDDSKRHMLEHASFISEIGRMKSTGSDTDSTTQIEELLGFMLRWIANHITNVDSQYAPYIKSQLK